MKNPQKLITLLFTVIFLGMVSTNSFSQDQRSYHVINAVEVNRTDCIDFIRLVIMLPYAQTNQYQTVSNVNYHFSDWLPIPDTDDQYLRFTLSQADIVNYGDIFNIYYDFNITLNTIDFDFSQITEIFPYDTTSNIYQWYTGTSGMYVDPNHSQIQAIGDQIWDQSTDILDYAEKCYEYVAANFSYTNPNTGIHPLAQILAYGGGDCGNLSSIYVSLLRYKNIPSRHIVTYRPDGSYHVWADFYLENYGWIPVDVTYKLYTPDGNYFGKYDGNGIVVSKEVWLYLERDEHFSLYAPLLQTYYWWYWWGAAGCNSITSRHVITSTELTSVDQLGEMRLKVFPNPSRDVFRISTAELIKSVTVFDANGRTVSHTDDINANESLVSGLQTGLHFMKVLTDKNVFFEKVIKE